MIEKIYNKITKSKKNTIIFIIILALISSIPAFVVPGINRGDDAYFHLSRICAIAENIRNLDFFKGVYPGYFNGYGYANGLFYPDVFFYIPALLNALGLNAIHAYKIFIVIINLLSITSIYISIKGISKNKYACILGSSIYAFAVYRIVDVYERAALGEALAFIFIPLVIYGIYEIIFEDKKKFYILTIGMTGLILSHVVSTYIIGIVLFVLCVFNIKKLFKEKRIIYLILAALITFLLTAFFLLPMIEQMASQIFYYKNISNFDEFDLSKRTVPFYLLFIGLPNVIPDIRKSMIKKYWLPAGIGVIFLYFIYKKLKHKEIKNKFIDQSFIISIIALVSTTITPIWKLKIVKKALYMIQFPWRLYMLPTVLLTISGSILMSKIKESKKLLRNVFILSAVPVISMVTICLLPRKIKNVEKYDASYAEYLPIEVDREYIKNRGVVITTNNETTHEFQKIGTNMKIEFKQNSNDTYMELPLIYYKGYNASIKKDNIETFKTENGLLGIKINDIKEGTISVEYIGTTLTRITKLISLISAIIFIIYVTKEVKHEK